MTDIIPSMSSAPAFSGPPRWYQSRLFLYPLLLLGTCAGSGVIAVVATKREESAKVPVVAARRAPAVREDPLWLRETDRLEIYMKIPAVELRSAYEELAKSCLEDRWRILEAHRTLTRGGAEPREALRMIPSLCERALQTGGRL